MRARVRWPLTIALCSAAGCYQVHERTALAFDAPIDASRQLDASPPVDSAALPDTPPRDGGRRDVGPVDAARWDGGPCDPGLDPSWPLLPCSPDIQAECDRMATEQAYGRFGYSRCTTPNGSGGTDAFCALGAYCSDGAPCRCTPTRQCGAGEVCVSDTPDGPRYCAYRCRR